MSLYLFSKKAENDLIEIYRYGFLNYGERKADFYSQGLKEKCQFLADTPHICHERNEFKSPVRIHHYKKHLIVYLIEGNNIFIVRILHERMDIQQYL